MSDLDCCTGDFDWLVSSLCDKGLDDQQLAHLNHLLRSSPELRRRYRVYMLVHTALHSDLGVTTAAETAADEAMLADARLQVFESEHLTRDECEPARWGLKSALIVPAAVVILGLVGLLGYVLRQTPQRMVPTVSAKASPIVARIARGAGVRFEGMDISPEPHEPLRAGAYRLVSGIVQVAFARGAEVMITAPAEFSLQSEERMFLVRGRLSARVPERAKGFTVETPSATFVDLGTEFAADVDTAGNGEVHVFQGEVIVQPRSRTDSRPLRLTESQASRIDAASATPSGIEVDSTRFLRRFDEPETSYSRLVSRLGPRLYLGMEPSVDGHSVIDSGSAHRAGRVVLGPGNGTPWSPGYLGSALRLRGPSFGEHALVPAFGKLEGNRLSVVAWVFAESRPRWGSIVKRWGEAGDKCFHFGLFGDDGDLEVHIGQPNSEEALAREGRPLATNRWHHVAFVADGTTLRLYRDGAQVAESPYRGIQPGTVDVLGIGVKLDGTGQRPDPGEPGYWHGRLDEISVFSQALTPEQIHQLHLSATRSRSDGQP